MSPTFDLPLFIPSSVGSGTALNATQATAKITVSGNPSSNPTFKVNGLDTEVTRGVSTTATATAIAAALLAAGNGCVAESDGAVVTLTSSVRGPVGNNMSLGLVSAGGGTITVTGFSGGGVIGTTYLDTVSLGTQNNTQELAQIDAPGIPKVLVKHVTHATISASASTKTVTLLSAIDQNNIVITDAFAYLTQNFSIAAGSAPTTTFELGIDSDPDWLITSVDVSSSGSIGDAFGFDATYDGAGWAFPTRVIGADFGPSGNNLLKIKFTVSSGNTSALDMGKLMVVVRYWEFPTLIGDKAGGLT